MANLLSMGPIRKIISRDNEQLKFARRVRDGREKGRIFLEGVRLVGEAARSRTACESVFVSTEFLHELPAEDITAWLRPRNIFEVSESSLQSLADTKNAQGIIAIADRPETGPDRIAQVATAATPLVVFLHEINNPSNLGAVIRSAEAAGIAGAIVSNSSADAFSPKALRAAMGSSLRLPIWTGVAFDEAIAWARANKLRSIAADVKGTKSYADVDWQIPRMLVLGSEAHGLDERDVERIDELIVIPIEKEVESLNLAVAAGVIMFEARRQSSVR
jgi:TrmH family RNA methyltransferase